MPDSLLRIVFMGSDPIALPLLEWLAAQQAVRRVEMVAVFTQPDRPVGRGQKVVANEIKNWALARALPVLQPARLGDPEYAALTAFAADVSLVMAYGHILRQRFIDAPRLGTLNFHASLLPRFRGASPIQTAIAAGEAETGVSLMRIVRQLDAGPVADVERVPIGPNDTAVEIEGALATACVPLLARNLAGLARGDLIFAEQEHGQATFCRRLEKEDGALDFAAPATVLAARINGLFPWPACVVPHAGQLLKVGLADAPAPLYPVAAPGTVLGADQVGLRVATGAGELRLLRLQRPGGRLLEAGEFLRGLPLTAGTVLASGVMRSLW
jgi:methionyl-tRNA formyltransferase